MNMLDQILILPNILSKQECENLIDEYEQRTSESAGEHCLHAVTGVLTASTFKTVKLRQGTQNYEIMFKKNEEVINKWLEYLSLFGTFNIPCLRRVLRCSHMYRLMKYSEGGWIHPHTDATHFVHASCTFALNDDYEGGDFVFFNGKHTVKLNKGDAMIWPADYFWVHEVRPVTKGFRYSTNSFICSLDWDSISEISEMVDHHMSKQRTYQIKGLKNENKTYA